MKECYGKLFPDPSELQSKSEALGKAFTMRNTSAGFGRRYLALDTDFAAWQDCEKCDLYKSCYDLSHAKFAMQTVVAEW